MKKKYNLLQLIIAVVLTAGLQTACMDGDWDSPDLTLPPYGNNYITEGTPTTIATLKTQFATEIANKGYKQVTEDVQLKAVVTGNDLGGNLYKQIAIQDETGYMIVGINATGLYAYLPVGQQLLINLKGLYVGGYGQQAQIGTEYNGSIGRLDDSDWQAHVRLVGTPDMTKVDTLDFDANWDMAAYSGALVRLTNVSLEGADGTAVLAPDDGSVPLTSNCANINIKGLAKTNVVLRTSTYSKFANMIIPQGEVDIYGIATRYNNTWQILMRTQNDLKVK